MPISVMLIAFQITRATYRAGILFILSGCGARPFRLYTSVSHTIWKLYRETALDNMYICK